jgi:hypothetical protein
MKLRLLVVFALLISAVAVNAQDAQASGLEAVDQLSLDGTVTITNVNSPNPGWIAIHADVDGLPGPVIGIAAAQAGTLDSVQIPIDVGGATPVLHAMLHVDDNTAGAFEFERVAGADLPVMNGDQMIDVPFRVTAIRGYDQAPVNNAVVVAAAVIEAGGWLVVHADENGAPGPVLGQAALQPGTTAGVVVPLAGDGLTAVVWPMLHVDDNTVGTYEFGTVEGADAPVVVNDQVATWPINLTETPTVFNGAGVPIEIADQFPALGASDAPNGDVLASGMGTYTVDSVFSVGPAWIDVHADAMGHPGPSLGVAPVADGQSENVPVQLDPMMMNPNAMVPIAITPVIWPMLHVDDGQPGVYEYMVIPGADLPVVVNGAVLAVPVSMDGAEATQDAGAAEATQDAGEATAEATEQAGS